MSQENVEIVRLIYEGWARGDFSAAEAFDPAVDFEMVDWPHPARSRGIAEMSSIWEETLSAWDDFRAEPSDFLDRGDSVLVFTHVEAFGKESGAEVSADTAAIWTIEDGKVVRLALYWDTATAQRAVGGF